MQSKFYQSIAILSIFATVLLVNSCTVDGKKEKQQDDAYKNNSVIKAEDSSAYEEYKEQQATCPWCEGSYRYFYKLSNRQIILVCDECTCIWIDPENLGLEHVIDVRRLEEKLLISESELFDINFSGWATASEVRQTAWKAIVHKNDLLIRPQENDELITPEEVDPWIRS